MNHKKLKDNQTIKTIFNSQNIGLYIFLIIALSVAWSTAKIIQKNYDLQKQIALLQQQVAIQEQENKNQALKNKYYTTDTYLELGARKYFSKSMPGEQVYAVSKEVAMSNVKPVAQTEVTKKIKKTQNKVIQNWVDWLNFMQGKKTDELTD